MEGVPEVRVQMIQDASVETSKGHQYPVKNRGC